MRLKIFGREILIGKDLSQYIGRADDMYGLMQMGTQYGVDYKSRHRLDAYQNIVYGCVSLIGESCGEYEPIVQRKKQDRWETIDHEFIDLLNKPMGNNGDAESFSKFDLFEATISYQLLQGDCFWYLARGEMTGRPREIVVLRPDKVGTDIDPKTGKINGYFIRRDGAAPIPLEVNEVLRFPFFNPKNPYQGKGVVEAGADYIATDEATATFTKNFFGNNAGISGVLNIKGEVSKGAFRKFVRGWREKYEGVTNAGKVAIIRQSDAEFTKVGLGLDEIDMSALRKMTTDDVLFMFKVPLPLLGKAEQTGLGRANVEALEYIFAKYNIDKKFKRWDSILQFALHRYYPDDAADTRIIHKNMIPADKEHDLLVRDKAVDRWMTRDEIRDEDGLDSVEGGDQLFVPINQVPINEASMEAAQPNNTQAGIRIKLVRSSKKKASDLSINAEKAERFRLCLMRNQIRYERQYKKILKPIFQAQRKEALTNLEAHSSSVLKSNQQKLFDDSAADALLVEKLTPMLTDLAQTQGGIALVFAGDDENEFHVTSNILTKIKSGTLRMATKFNDDTLAALNATLAEGVQAGEGIASLKKRVESVYDDVEGYRSERIARTETLKASNSATLDAYRQTGYVTGKEWVVNPGACEQCEEFEGKTLPLDDAYLGIGQSYTVTDGEGNETIYTNDYDTIEGPPLHPNCRCTIIPVR